MPELPEVTQAEVNDYLDALRQSGVTNMFGAAPYIAQNFGISRSDARKMLSEWMRTFGKPDRARSAPSREERILEHGWRAYADEEGHE